MISNIELVLDALASFAKGPR
ncbi:Protein of unknown function [Bacillus cereus]|uniref:Uncharacterized protein n=1 Tax=Bacillus wiedmannii TaxID=1890302 RepID=A0AB37YT98_9BACI|nr:Protein of unknown function [Bacillus cereus]SCC43171.1 Protein of unknown function [Bacillus wiedmannii]SCN04543.1 Protein of unknown function [Bacillus wiedmannii]SCN34026.1 Protein of unknown function [Bacillus wiedmannii]SCV20123.1 Protein of unknown function [Bacillus cereus]